ncbi:hypothetical protein EBZ70_01400 [bacterium]|nr:hypothetical protein [bacterium]
MKAASFRSLTADLGLLVQNKTDPISGIGDPAMIRVYSGTRKGATAFFRNRPFLTLLLDAMEICCTERPRIFFHACSVGAEPYSLALWYLHRAQHKSTLLPLIEATDVEPAFLEVARAGIYPKTILDGMTQEERSWFEILPDDLVRVPAAARELVRFRDAQSFLDPINDGPYDAVLAMNALTYVSPEEQSVAIRHMANRALHVLGLSAFHPDSIRDNIRSVGFEYVDARAEEIHEAWVERRVSLAPQPGTPEYSWQLPPFSHPVPDREYRFCSLFARAEVITPH